VEEIKKQLRLGFHGSRTLHDERVKIIILEEIEKHAPTTIVTHAEPEGVCEIVRSVCKEKAIPLCVHFLNFKYLRGAFEHRSKDVLKDSDYSIFIHDGRSKGTSNELKLVQGMNKKYTLHTMEITKYKSSVGFDIDIDWENESTGIEFNVNPEEANAKLDEILGFRGSGIR
jgi:hypothetical protein